MYFSEYGTLGWLDPQQYFAEPWKYLCSAEGADGEMYDIVIIDDYPCQIRYTHI